MNNVQIVLQDKDLDLDRDEKEIALRGYLGDVTIELTDGRRFCVTFYDPVRLGQTIEDDLRVHGEFVEPGLIVVEAVTKANILRALERLVTREFFSKLTPLAQSDSLLG